MTDSHKYADQLNESEFGKKEKDAIKARLKEADFFMRKNISFDKVKKWKKARFRTKEYGSLIPYLEVEIEVTSDPPYKPTIDVPPSGKMGVSYVYTANTTDPDGDKINYWFDWGDGTVSDWIGPVPHQTPVQGSHAWDEDGVYEVRAKAKDINDDESDWSDPHTITIVAGPILNTGTIKGGLLRVSVPIKNIGATVGTGVQWSINLVGGAFIGKETNGTDDIPAGGEINATSGLIIGFGATVVTVTAEIPEMSDVEDEVGCVFLIFTNVNASGGI